MCDLKKIWKVVKNHRFITYVLGCIVGLILLYFGYAWLQTAQNQNTNLPFNDYQFKVYAGNHENISVSDINFTLNFGNDPSQISFDIRGREFKNLKAITIQIPSNLSFEKIILFNSSNHLFSITSDHNNSYYLYKEGEDYATEFSRDFDADKILKIHLLRNQGYEVGVKIFLNGTIVPNGHFTFEITRGEVHGRGEPFIDLRLADYRCHPSCFIDIDNRLIPLFMGTDLYIRANELDGIYERFILNTYNQLTVTEQQVQISLATGLIMGATLFIFQLIHMLFENMLKEKTKNQWIILLGYILFIVVLVYLLFFK